MSKREGTLDSLGSVKFYQKWGKVYGLEFVDFADYSSDVSDHYETVSQKPVFGIDRLVDTWASTSTNTYSAVKQDNDVALAIISLYMDTVRDIHVIDMLELIVSDCN